MKILWLGDFFYDYDFISKDIEKISEWIHQNEYKVILNLEGTIDSGSFNKINKRGPNLSAAIETIEVLKKLNVIGVCLANNHIMDFSNEGLEHTIKLLDTNNIQHTGAGDNIKEAIKPIVIEENDKKIAIFNFGWDVEETVYATDISAGCAKRDEDFIINIIDKNKNLFDKIVVCFHWGFEYNRLPMPYDIDLGHKVIEHGGDMIIGNHPHCVQPKEVYNNKSIYYSLGNFYFSSSRKKFNLKFNEEVSNQSDYGIGVIRGYFDNEQKQEVLIKYDKNTDITTIEDVSDDILKNIDFSNFLDKKYIREVKKNKRNINPILTTNENKNKKRIKKLNSFYNLKYKIKKILKKFI